eukprot:TRINITY_DN12182_c0_g2_i1.p1 TRINITY_DN12182_c0_g2~~TRINITY_DN12182_c0_g2_i1.p1  ORF type:complete len:209 (+),score=74.65 TRINITY_DN12182_c0_g2_i1:317-943(+)
MTGGLVAVGERAAGGGPVLNSDGDEEVRRTQSQVAIVLGSSQEELGTLFITTRRLIWLSDEATKPGFAVDFKSLSMHAISRDEEAYPRPCIYAQIDTDAVDHGEFEGDDEEEVEEGAEAMDVETPTALDLQEVSEIRLVPLDSSVLDQLFQTLCECALLNPDQAADDEEGEFFYDEDEVVGNLEAANPNGFLGHPEQFDDAEADEDSA